MKLCCSPFEWRLSSVNAFAVMGFVNFIACCSRYIDVFNGIVAAVGRGPGPLSIPSNLRRGGNQVGQSPTIALLGFFFIMNYYEH